MQFIEEDSLSVEALCGETKETKYDTSHRKVSRSVFKRLAQRMGRDKGEEK